MRTRRIVPTPFKSLKKLCCIVPPSYGGQVSLFFIILEDTPEADKLAEIEKRMHPHTGLRLGWLEVEGIRLHVWLDEILVDSSVCIPDQDDRRVCANG